MLYLVFLWKVFVDDNIFASVDINPYPYGISSKYLEFNQQRHECEKSFSCSRLWSIQDFYSYRLHSIIYFDKSSYDLDALTTLDNKCKFHQLHLKWRCMLIYYQMHIHIKNHIMSAQSMMNIPKDGVLTRVLTLLSKTRSYRMGQYHEPYLLKSIPV